MNITNPRITIALAAYALLGFLCHTCVSAQATLTPAPPATPRDGQHDFDFEAGTWKIHLKRLLHPLTGSTTWVEFDGTSVTRKVWDGRAWLEEFETTGPSGHVEGLTLRLYNPQSRQWSLYWANSKDGTLGQPTIGEFINGRGEFFDQEPFNGRVILVRYVWSDITPNSAHFEQSFSADGGKTWEVNWITDQTRVPEGSAKAHLIHAPCMAARGRLPFTPVLLLYCTFGPVRQTDFDRGRISLLWIVLRT